MLDRYQRCILPVNINGNADREVITMVCGGFFYLCVCLFLLPYKEEIIKKIALIGQSSIKKTSTIIFTCHNGHITAGDF